MGSSYRSDLKAGFLTEWQGKLQSACALILDVRREASSALADEGQSDNAAETGGLLERLDIAYELIMAELPVTSRVA